MLTKQTSPKHIRRFHHLVPAARTRIPQIPQKGGGGVVAGVLKKCVTATTHLHGYPLPCSQNWPKEGCDTPEQAGRLREEEIARGGKGERNTQLQRRI
mmetsp:Transcript_46488/g.46960  ORF Transcript_46488/g.46960 Transcript_46488/m.46960 type:complete len:98 (+) Transcript_46488:407-700(+)